MRAGIILPGGDANEQLELAVLAEELVAPWADAGCTWWLETNWEMPHHSGERMAQVRTRLLAGPPGAGTTE